MDLSQNSLKYGDFIPAKKSNFSLKIAPDDGNFVRVKPNVIKLSVDGDKVSVVSKLSLAERKSQGSPLESENTADDFIFEEPCEGEFSRRDEIAKFLEEDKRSLKIEKAAVKLARKYMQREEKAEESANLVRHPIGRTLVVIISFLLVLAVGSVTYAVSYFVTQDTKSNAEENNLVINSRTAIDTENRINSAVASVTMLLDMIFNSNSDANNIALVEKMFFDRNKNIIAIYYSKGEEGVLFSSETFLVSHELEKQTVLSYIQQENESA